MISTALGFYQALRRLIDSLPVQHNMAWTTLYSNVQGIAKVFEQINNAVKRIKNLHVRIRCTNDYPAMLHFHHQANWRCDVKEKSAWL